MPTRPAQKKFVGDSMKILNAIRNSATTNYKDFVPYAAKDGSNLREIGNVIMQFPTVQNEFINTLINRIAMVYVHTNIYKNPWSFFKKGELELGEVIEEVIVNLATPYKYNPEISQNTFLKRHIPDVRTAFHIMNWQYFYPTTINNNDLKLAFTSYNGVEDLIAKITGSLYTSLSYDEFLTMKYMLAKRLIMGLVRVKEIPPLEKDNLEDIISLIKAESNNWEFMKAKYNIAGIKKAVAKENQYLIINTTFEANTQVQVLASAFNRKDAEFYGRVVLVDGFGDLDIERLGILFSDDPTYTEFSLEELEALNKIPAIAVDDTFFMVFDNLNQFTENYNGESMEWRYNLHAWRTFGISPFANNTAYIPAVPEVTAITISPSTATVTAGQTLNLVANVAVENFAPQTVNWSSDTENVSVDPSGVVTVDRVVASGTVVKITATSTFNTNISGESTITIA